MLRAVPSMIDLDLAMGEVVDEAGGVTSGAVLMPPRSSAGIHHPDMRRRRRRCLRRARAVRLRTVR